MQFVLMPQKHLKIHIIYLTVVSDTFGNEYLLRYIFSEIGFHIHKKTWISFVPIPLPIPIISCLQYVVKKYSDKAIPRQ